MKNLRKDFSYEKIENFSRRFPYFLPHCRKHKRDKRIQRLVGTRRQGDKLSRRIHLLGKRLFGKIRKVERVNNWLKIEIGVYLDD